MQCDPVPLAARYRWRIKVAGVDEAFPLSASTTAPQATNPQGAAGAAVDLLVQAASGSQGVPSATVRVVLSAPGDAARAAFTAPVGPAGEQAGEGALLHGNGIRNGNRAVTARS